MATCVLSDELQPLADGEARIPVLGMTIREAIDEVAAEHPRLAAAVLSATGGLPSDLTVLVNDVPLDELHGLDTELSLLDVVTLALTPSERSTRGVHLSELQREVLAASVAGDGATLRKIGEEYERLGDRSGAAGAYRRAGRMGEARAWRHLGRLHERDGDVVRAAELYTRGAAENDVISLRLLAQLHEREGERDVAARTYQEAIERGDVVSLRLLARLYQRQGDHARSEALLEAAWRQGDRVAARLLGALMMESGDEAGALAAWESAAAMGDRNSARLLARHRRDPAAGSAHAVAISSLDGPGTDVAAETESQELTADAGARMADADERTVAGRILSDLPSEEDRLGVDPLVRGLTQLLGDCRTKLPLAIAITGPWGGGKSSVMLQLRCALARSSADDLVSSHDGDDGLRIRRWQTVEFDAWKYERRERLWAALATAIYERPQKTMTGRQRLAFRVRLEWRRRGFLGLARDLWPLPLAAAGAIAALATEIHAVGVAGVASAVVTFGASVGRTTGLVSEPFKRAMQRYSQAPDYQATLGFTERAEHDIGCLLEALAPGPHDGVAIFVDDLDRCSSEHVVEVVETMNQMFNSHTDRRCLFVLGMDREVVAAAIDVAYAPTVRRLARTRNPLANSFGMQFLAKLVQLSVSIPPPHTAAMRALLDHITETGDGEHRSADAAMTPIGDAAQTGSDGETADVALRELDPSSLEDVAEIGDQLRSSGVLTPTDIAQAERRARARLLATDSPEVAAAERAVVGCLEANPRQLKRFDNAFRLQLYVASEASSVRFSPDELIALARLVVVRLRWPQLAEALDDEPSLLAELERHANSTAEERAASDAGGLERHGGWFGDLDVLSVLQAPDAAHRVSALPLDAFLRIV